VQLYTTPREFRDRIHPVNARIGEATLVGYRLAGSDGDETRLHGNSLVIHLYWRALQKVDRDLTVFVHAIDSSQKIVAQKDGIPANGMWPTSEWLPGELVVDSYSLPVDASNSALSLVVGMYDSATMARVLAFDANGLPLPEGRVPLTQVTITP
jgi:hypothetical protein